MAKLLSQSDKLLINLTIDKFNKEIGTKFEVSIKGRFVYIFVLDDDVETKLGRLEYHGRPDNWSFAMFKYSSERYHPDELMYPGFFELDGTVEGGLKASVQLYGYYNGNF